MAKLPPIVFQFDRRNMRNMSENIRAIIVFLLSALVAVLPFYGAYQLWAWAMAQITAGEYAGIIRVLTTLAMILFGFTPTFGLSVLLFIAAAYVLLFVFRLDHHL
jgi:hypothetical protein